jgi:hypothetical protein
MDFLIFGETSHEHVRIMALLAILAVCAIPTIHVLSRIVDYLGQIHKNVTAPAYVEQSVASFVSMIGENARTLLSLDRLWIDRMRHQMSHLPYIHLLLRQDARNTSPSLPRFSSSPSTSSPPAFSPAFEIQVYQEHEKAMLEQQRQLPLSWLQTRPDNNHVENALAKVRNMSFCIIHTNTHICMYVCRWTGCV